MFILEVEDLALSLGGSKVLSEVAFSVKRGEILGIIGPNGAGKTSLLNSVNGVYPPQKGTIRFAGELITGMHPHKIARLGIARTFQNLETLQGSTVLDNVLVGLHAKYRSSIFADGLRIGPSLRAERRNRATVLETLEKVGLAGFADSRVGQLPYGKQKLVEVARAVVSGPQLLLLDEPVAGMNRDEKAEISEVLKRFRDTEGLTQVVIEHDVQFVNVTCERLAFLHLGSIRVIGEPSYVLRLPEVVTAYIGTGASLPAAGINDQPRGGVE
jgi:branched-chain amino acid transport system ATP-binding protein